MIVEIEGGVIRIVPAPERQNRRSQDVPPAHSQEPEFVP
jgi:hypothetical protein